MLSLILKPQEDIQKVQKKGIARTNLLDVKNSFLSHCESLFSELEGPDKSLLTEHADALYHSSLPDNFLKFKERH